MGPEHRAASRLCSGLHALLCSGDENVGAPTYTHSWTRVEIRMPHGMGSAGHTGLPVLYCPQAPETGAQAPQGLVPNPALHSRFLVLVALQAAHLPLVHLGHVYVGVDHKLILANAEKERRRG